MRNLKIEVLARSFNPLISGADRATKPLWGLLTSPKQRFNPLISGADRATFAASASFLVSAASFQSPHKRGGSRDTLPRLSLNAKVLQYQF